VCFLVQCSFSQTMTIYKSDSTSIDFDVSQIDSITFSGRAGNALSLDGDSSYVEIQNSPSLSLIDSAITIEAWVKLQSHYYNTVVCKGSADYAIEFVGQYPGFLFQNLNINYNGATDYYGRLVLNQTIPLNTWTHIAVTYFYDSSLCVYINGTLAYHTSATGTIYRDSSNLRIGARVDSNYFEPCSGLIDEVRIWDRARSADEIATTMRQDLTGPEPGLVGYWKFSESAGSAIANDSSQYGNTGVLHGKATFVKSFAF